MNLDILVEMELNRWDWSNILEANGPATNIPLALREFIYAPTPKDAKQAYWNLENHIVVQGNVFEAAVYAVPVLMAALVKQDRPTHFVILTMDLFYLIIAGDVHADEVARGKADLQERCVAAIREGLWVLHAQHVRGGVLRECVGEVICALERDVYRLNYVDQYRDKI